jgi:hypothetical protein
MRGRSSCEKPVMCFARAIIACMGLPQEEIVKRFLIII